MVVIGDCEAAARYFGIFRAFATGFFEEVDGQPLPVLKLDTCDQMGNDLFGMLAIVLDRKK